MEIVTQIFGEYNFDVEIIRKDEKDDDSEITKIECKFWPTDNYLIT